MDSYDRGSHQADRVLDHRPDHFLTPFAANQIGFALFVSHGDSLTRESLDQFLKDVKARLGSMRLRHLCTPTPSGQPVGG